MTTKKQKEAAKENIKKAQEKWKSMSSRQRSLAQPEGEDRAEPGSVGEGDYYRIEVRDGNQFTSFRTHDVGEKGGIQRIAGHRKSGSWDTQTWLISKKMAKKEGNTIVATHEDAQKILDQLGSEPKHMKGDIFKAKPRPNVPEHEKPTEAQKKAREENIKKAQEARRE
jgi:hypothetical protein